MKTQTEAQRLAEKLEARSEKQLLGQLDNAAAAELRRLDRFEVAHIEWLKKTEWVQETIKPCEFGMHRADALKARIAALEAELIEQARIVGMGAERELAAQARIAELEAAAMKCGIGAGCCYQAHKIEKLEQANAELLNMNAQLREQNTEVDAVCAKLEQANAELLEALIYIEGVAMADEPRDLPGIVQTARAALQKHGGQQ